MPASQLLISLWHAWLRVVTQGLHDWLRRLIGSNFARSYRWDTTALFKKLSESDPQRLKIAILTTDNRQHFQDYSNPMPYFGMAPEALLQGLACIKDLEVHVISCVRREMKSPEKIANNIWFHSLLVPKFGWMTSAYQGCIRAVRKRLQELRPDIVHGQGSERECAISAVLSGFPNVITIHGNMAELARLFKHPVGSFGWLAAKFETFALWKTAGVFCNSQYTESLVRPRARRTWLVPNAIREQFFSPIAEPLAPRSKCVLTNVGLISPRKRQLELLDTARQLKERGLNFEFHFIGHLGTDAYAEAFLERIKPLESAGFARFLGPKSTTELIEAFDLASGMVHFPSEEAFGLVVAEGLARNLKFFGAHTGGIIDISEGVPGVELVDVEDWERLSSAITGWISSGAAKPEDVAKLMEARYHPAVIAKRHVEIYREVLSANHADR
jgi:glycosyltransferase involved in cell wall biosynthesis